MEVHLGKFLKTNEVIHHKDGNGLNNSLNNLELLSASEHSKKHHEEKRRSLRLTCSQIN